MGVKVKAQKFDTLNKALVKGRVGHTRTGACTSAGRCHHGMIDRPKFMASGKKQKSLLKRAA